MIDRLFEIIQLAVDQRDPIHLQVLADALDEEGLPLFAERIRRLSNPCWDLIAMYRDKIQQRSRFREMGRNAEVAADENAIVRHYSDEWNRYLDGLEESSKSES